MRPQREPEVSAGAAAITQQRERARVQLTRAATAAGGRGLRQAAPEKKRCRAGRAGRKCAAACLEQRLGDERVACRFDRARMGDERHRMGAGLGKNTYGAAVGNGALSRWQERVDRGPTTGWVKRSGR